MASFVVFWGVVDDELFGFFCELGCVVSSMASLECMYNMIVLTTRQVNREDTSAPCFFDIESSGHVTRRGMSPRLSPSPFPMFQFNDSGFLAAI